RPSRADRSDRLRYLSFDDLGLHFLAAMLGFLDEGEQPFLVLLVVLEHLERHDCSHGFPSTFDHTTCVIARGSSVEMDSIVNGEPAQNVRAWSFFSTIRWRTSLGRRPVRSTSRRNCLVRGPMASIAAPTPFARALRSVLPVRPVAAV